MKRKEIAKHLDAVGEIVGKTGIETLTDDKESVKELASAALLGLTTGIALSSEIVSGDYKTHTPKTDATIAIVAMLDALMGGDDD